MRNLLSFVGVVGIIGYALHRLNQAKVNTQRIIAEMRARDEATA